MISRRCAFVPLFLLVASGAVRAGQDGVQIGMTLPLTGTESKTGKRIRDGVQLAIDQQNAGGGVEVGQKKLPLRLEVVDDGGEPGAAAHNVEALAGHGASLLLAGYPTPVVDATAPVVERLRLPAMSFAASSSTFKHGYKYVFGAFAPIDQMANATLRWVEERQRAGNLPPHLRVAVLWEQTGHGRDYREGVLAFVSRTATRRDGYGSSVVLDRSFPLNTTNFKALLAELRAARADVVLVDAHPAEFVAMHRQYLADGLCHPVLSYGARGTDADSIAAFPAGSTDYLVAGTWWNAQLGARGESAEFTQAFKARYQRTPDWPEAIGYEAGRALIAAVGKAKTLDAERVRDALATLRMESILPSGMLSFPAEYGGQAQSMFAVQQNLPGGKSPIVYPMIAATSRGLAPNPNCPATAHAQR